VDLPSSRPKDLDEGLRGRREGFPPAASSVIEKIRPVRN